MSGSTVYLRTVDPETVCLWREIEQLQMTIQTLTSRGHETTDATAHLDRMLARIKVTLRAKDVATPVEKYLV